MMKRVGGNAVLASAVAMVLVGFGWSHYAKREGIGGVSFVPKSISIDDMPEGEFREVGWRVSNRRAIPVTVEITASCGCVSVPQREMTIGAAEDVVVPCMVDTSSVPTNSVVIVQIKELDQVLATGVMEVWAKRRFVLAAHAIALDEGGAGGVRVYCIAPRGEDELSLRSDSEALHCKLVRMSPRVWRVEVHAEPWYDGTVWNGARVVGICAVITSSVSSSVLPGVSADARGVKRVWWWRIGSKAGIRSEGLRPEGFKDVIGERVCIGGVCWYRWECPQDYRGRAFSVELTWPGGSKEVKAVWR